MRADGKRVTKGVDNMYTIVPYIMVDRSDACNAITVKVPYEPIRQYVNKVRNNGGQVSYLSVLTAAFLRAVCEYPFLNRFVVNKRIYSRNELAFAMVVMRPDNSQTSMGKMKFDYTDNIFQVNDKINDFVSKNRNEDANETDKIMNALVKFPFLIRMATNILKFADKHSLLPKAVIDASPFHATTVISNLASIRTNHIHHHIYNFGTVSTIITIGNMEDIPKMKNGEIVLERYMPLGIVCDERIGDGHAYARAFAALSRYLKNPELLEQSPEKIITD